MITSHALAVLTTRAELSCEHVVFHIVVLILTMTNSHRRYDLNMHVPTCYFCFVVKI